MNESSICSNSIFKNCPNLDKKLKFGCVFAHDLMLMNYKNLNAECLITELQHLQKFQEDEKGDLISQLDYILDLISTESSQEITEKVYNFTGGRSLLALPSEKQTTSITEEEQMSSSPSKDRMLVCIN